MTETAVRRRAPWLAATVHSVRSETSVARTIVLDVPGWPGHVAGQHADVKLTAPDGYSAQRSYSIAAPADGDRVELTVQRVEDGEVSPYLVDELLPTDQLEVRGPVGGWFTWRPAETGPVLLVAGGSGIVPLMAMVRERARAGSTAPFTLVYSVRGPSDVYYAHDLAAADIDTTVLYTRTGTDTRPAGRITAADLPPSADARVYVRGLRHGRPVRGEPRLRPGPGHRRPLRVLRVGDRPHRPHPDRRVARPPRRPFGPHPPPGGMTGFTVRGGIMPDQ